MLVIIYRYQFLYYVATRVVIFLRYMYVSHVPDSFRLEQNAHAHRSMSSSAKP